MYNRYLKEVKKTREPSKSKDATEQGLPACRKLPANIVLPAQTVKEMESILVGTGVYKHDEEKKADADVYHGHRDFVDEPALSRPSK